VVLGKTGRNFAAGMSGGIAYVFDEDGQFTRRCNPAMVTLEKVLPADEQALAVDRSVWHQRDGQAEADDTLLKSLIEQHHSWTGSLRARDILDDWSSARGRFVKVFPNEYRRALGEINAARARNQTIAKARAEAKAVPAK
jgi:glutamate synthase domain-containing protein 3